MTPRAEDHALHHVQSATAVAVALLLSTGLGSGLARAQTALDEVTVIAQPPLGISGFDDVPMQALPLNVSIFSQADLRDIGAQRVSDALLLDTSVSESYNLPAYWDKLSVRGFTLDNRYNFRRDGLPISAQTIIGLENKERIELLKGTSGIQAGTSAPGGLVNYVVKRPPSRDTQSIREVALSYGPGDTRSVALDVGNRFGEQAQWGYRLNVAHTDLNPVISDTQGQRELVALAMDWRLDAKNRLEWEFEHSHVEQIGVNFYSLLGNGPNALPAPVDGTRNITRQPNSRPGVFDGRTGSVRFKHQLENNWLWTTHYGLQKLLADDRLVYASGCSPTMTDRFCANGDFQIYDYNTDNERRSNEVAQTSLSGQTQLGGLTHGLTVSVMRQRLVDDMPRMQTSTLLGITNSLTGGLTLTSQASNQNGLLSNTRDASTELALKDHIQLSDHSSAWLGLRYTQLQRQTALTDGSGATQDVRNFMTPWLAMSHQLDTGHMVFASTGQGIESEVAPNNTMRYSNAGQALPTMRSHQHEIGIKSVSTSTHWQATWFDITRPASGDAWGCNNGGTCTREMDGQAHHTGLELSAHTTARPGWRWGSSATWLRARRENASSDPSLNGQRPINVPNYLLRGLAEYRFASITGLRTGLRLSREGKRNVTEHGDIVLPAWTILDATAHYDTRLAQHHATWSLGIQNITNKHYWRESPKQYGQYFLNPGTPRTLRANVQWHL